MSDLVLVVDDDPAQRDGLAEVLETRGYAVAQAANGWEALELAIAERPTMILLDLNMPVMDGWEVLHALKGSGTLRNIPVVVLTGDPDAPNDITLMAKPYGIDHLLGKVERVLGRPARAAAASGAAAADDASLRH
jgi:two-component system, cell cycle response regulator DivK